MKNDQSSWLRTTAYSALAAIMAFQPAYANSQSSTPIKPAGVEIKVNEREIIGTVLESGLEPAKGNTSMFGIEKNYNPKAYHILKVQTPDGVMNFFGYNDKKTLEEKIGNLKPGTRVGISYMPFKSPLGEHQYSSLTTLPGK